MLQDQDLLFSEQDIISTYTRKQAIADGLQVCVSEKFPRDTRMYKFPVYFTTGVWELCQEQGAIIWDICYMAALQSKRQEHPTNLVEFTVMVQGAERNPDYMENGEAPIYKLWTEIGAKDFDDPSPAITFMFPEEH